MAKDPAINWYFDNWGGGTIGFTRHQKGCYMDLLEAQFYLGPLTLDQVKNILGSDFNQWNFLQNKFTKNEQDQYFNERMELEKAKRRKFSEKQSINGKKGGRPKTQTKPKQNPILNPNESLYETETETGTDIGFENARKGVQGENVTFPIEHCLKIALGDQRWTRANKTNETEVQFFVEYLEKQGIYEMNPWDFKKYFAKLKGKYPEMLKQSAKEFSIEELRKIALELDKNAA